MVRVAKTDAIANYTLLEFKGELSSVFRCMASEFKAAEESASNNDDGPVLTAAATFNSLFNIENMTIPCWLMLIELLNGTYTGATYKTLVLSTELAFGAGK